MTSGQRSTRIGILGNPQSPYVVELSRAVEALRTGDCGESVTATCLSFSDLSAEIRTDSPAALFADVDAILVRSMPLGSLEQVIFRMDCLQVLQHAGVQVINPPKTLETAIDKWLTLHHLQAASIAVPWTIACQTRNAAMEAFEKLGRHVVVKPIFGGEGRGIVQILDADMAWRVFSTLEQTRSVMYVQQFYEHFGYDIRVLFIGERPFAIRRVAQPGSWKTNLTLGSRAEPHTLTDEQLSIATDARAAIGGSVIGVDLLPCKNGQTLVLEVNAVPGWKGLSKALNVDVASLVIRHVCDRVHQPNYV